MSNHGQGNPFGDAQSAEFVRKLLEGSQPKLEEMQKEVRGQFPNGKLTPDDEGALVMEIGTQDGIVVMNFGEPASWIGFGPEQAMDLADCLKNAAQSLLDARKP